jgi:hypothetical protein
MEDIEDSLSDFVRCGPDFQSGWYSKPSTPELTAGNAYFSRFNLLFLYCQKRAQAAFTSG